MGVTSFVADDLTFGDRERFDFFFCGFATSWLFVLCTDSGDACFERPLDFLSDLCRVFGVCSGLVCLLTARDAASSALRFRSLDGVVVAGGECVSYFIALGDELVVPAAAPPRWADSGTAGARSTAAAA